MIHILNFAKDLKFNLKIKYIFLESYCIYNSMHDLNPVNFPKKQNSISISLCVEIKLGSSCH